MRKIILIVFAIGFLIAQNAIAQSRTITGKVKDRDSGQALPGVAVVLKGTGTGASTGVDGTYSLSIPSNQPNATLVFKFLGMLTQEVAVGTVSIIDVSLEADAKQLSEVVVTGYNTQNKREVAGSIATVKAEEVSQVP